MEASHPRLMSITVYPQGSLLGPVCFLGSVNDLPEEAQNENGETNLFADDSTTFEIGNTVDDAISKIKKTAKHIESYSSNNSLTIHPDKCELLIISKSKFIGPIQNLNIKGRPVNIVESSKSLGITIDNKLSWNQQTDKTCKNFSAKLKKLYNMRSLSPKTLESIYFSGILPSVLYCISIWGSSSRLSEVNKIHVRAACFIKKLSKKIPDEDILSKAN